MEVPEGRMETWGIGVAALLALWRYVLDLDWDMRLKLRKRRRGRPGA
jgi:hypothetical protein